ncbi:MAG: AsmA family protein [Saprospiraceae bacterium]|nr:AsmA family protein [Saprospiraceae bacterium]
MGKFLKRFIIFLLILVAVLALAWVVIASMFEKQVGQKLVSTINKQLKTELTVREFDLSAIRTLPNVAANLKGVALKDNRGGVLLEAEELSFRFGLLSLFGSSLNVKSVVVSDGALNIQIDKQGRSNYDIFKEPEPSERKTDDDEGTKIDLETAQLRNMEMIYEDAGEGQSILMNVKNASFAGQFSSKKFALKSEAAIVSSFVEMDSTRYLVGQNIGYEADILVNLEQGVYDLQKVNVTLGENVFNVDGTYETWEEGPYFDLFFTCTKGNLSSLIALLPEQYLALLSDFTSRGDFEFKAAIKGQSKQGLDPEIRAEVNLQNGRIESPRMKEPLRDVSFRATFTNGKFRADDSAIFEIKNLKGYFNRELFEMRLKVENLDDPRIDFLANGAVPMESLYGLFNNPKITGGSGEIEVKNLLLNGRYKDMVSTNTISRVRAGGEIEFDDAALTINEEKMVIDRGRLLLNGDTLSVPEFELNGAGSDILFKGQAISVIPFLFADSLNTNRVELQYQADLQSQNLDIDRLMKLSALTEDEQKADTLTVDSLKSDNIQKRQQFTQFLKGIFNARIQNFNYNEIKGNDFVGKLEFNNNELIINGDTKAMQGAFDLDGKVYFEKAPRLTAKLTCEKIDATEFFRQTENFGQDILTNQNVSGTLNAQIAIYAYWDTTGTFLYDKLRVLAGLDIQNGQLKDFKMMEQFSTYVKMRDLMDIRFANLENYIEIADQKLYLPVMFIQSNAMNLTVSGEHSFENEMDYNIKVNAGQVMANRFKTSSSQPQPAKKKGWFNLYFNIAGTVDEYNVQTAKKEVQKNFLFSERRKERVQEALEREFGSVRKIEEPAETRDVEYLDEVEGGQGN